MLTLASFLLTLGILVTIHEYGHFQVARWCGVKVLRFSIGFGKPLFTRKFGKDQTEFVLAALPLGGYVKMLDEREASNEGAPPINEQDLPRAFNRQPVWKRIAIVSAGPIANLLLAIFLYWILFMHGVTGMKPILGEIEQNSPASHASMRSGDIVRKVGDVAVSSWQDVRWELLRQVIKAPVVEIETVTADNDVHLHQLQLGSIGKDDFENDFLDKLGLKPFQPEVPARIGEIIAGGAAEKAGLKSGDQILSVAGVGVTQWEGFVSEIRKNPGKPLSLEIKRGESTSKLTITPDAVEEGSQKIGRIGAAYHMEQAELDKLIVDVKYGPITALSKAAGKTWDTSIFSLKMLGSMITGEVSWKGMSGPVTIASYAGQSAHIGWKAFIGFLAVISISLGVLNLLPIPVLDGGHLLYYMVEIFKGSPVSEQVMEVGQRVGLSLLGLLMACALYNDFNRLITG
ncbi:MAG TPA: RIP metalloprotease RseP [Methylophilaceae bacterium]|nr:RIP metalloprotease RseP [Methylophilaceae bacterium]